MMPLVQCEMRQKYGEEFPILFAIAEVLIPEPPRLVLRLEQKLLRIRIEFFQMDWLFGVGAREGVSGRGHEGFAVIDKDADLFRQFSDALPQLIAALSEVLLEKPRMEFPLLGRKETAYAMLQMWYPLLEFQDADSQGKMVVISYEIRLIVLDKISTEHRALDGKSHVAHMALLPYLAQVFTGFLDLALCQKRDAQVLHDEHIIRRDGQCSLEQDHPLFHISRHGIGPSEIPEDFRVIRAFGVGLLQVLYSCREIVSYQGHISPQIQSRRSLLLQGFGIIKRFFSPFVISFIDIDVSELFIELIALRVTHEGTFDHGASLSITLVRLEPLYFIDDGKFMIHIFIIENFSWEQII